MADHIVVNDKTVKTIKSLGKLYMVQKKMAINILQVLGQKPKNAKKSCPITKCIIKSKNKTQTLAPIFEASFDTNAICDEFSKMAIRNQKKWLKKISEFHEQTVTHLSKLDQDIKGKYEKYSKGKHKGRYYIDEDGKKLTIESILKSEEEQRIEFEFMKSIDIIITKMEEIIATRIESRKLKVSSCGKVEMEKQMIYFLNVFKTDPGVRRIKNLVRTISNFLSNNEKVFFNCNPTVFEAIMIEFEKFGIDIIQNVIKKNKFNEKTIDAMNEIISKAKKPKVTMFMDQVIGMEGDRLDFHYIHDDCRVPYFSVYSALSDALEKIDFEIMLIYEDVEEISEIDLDCEDVRFYSPCPCVNSGGDGYCGEEFDIINAINTLPKLDKLPPNILKDFGEQEKEDYRLNRRRLIKRKNNIIGDMWKRVAFSTAYKNFEKRGPRKG